ncbi:MAG: hypothetical protein K8H88_20390, partial [Sandaracinaceae bacterium]|nr:hypothetical protein [Sandaracinaceae bacterium]
APGADPEAARVALAHFHAAHSTIAHRVIAPAIELGFDPDFVVLDCPARLDLAGLLMIARGPEPRVRHGAADGFITSLRDALFAAAEHEDPRDGGPCCIGTLGHANVLFARDGRFWLVGLGHNVALADEHGRIGGPTTAFQAPEVSVGARPTRSSDFVTLLLFMRSLVPFMVLERSLVRILAGNSLAEDLELVTKLVWFERRIFSSLPQTRASIDEAIATSDRIRELLHVYPDAGAFQAAIAGIVADHPRLSPGSESAALRVASDGASFERRGSGPSYVPGRGPLRKLVCALARARLDKPGTGLSVTELFAEGWPGERASLRSARNRVHVAVATLRKLGLGGDLESHGGTYRISPSVVIEWVEPDPVSRVSERSPRG